ncbi:ABC transporter substrate-binding protein [Gilvimarinus sp. DA14]|uniref:substrate-binding periplasmic protein n=1 Tax=Gilvimarinus sp. DA14 TaxID=2956798 RepID=UPI0020B860A1|nr:transporter substrate-binding domain-containing protein [Gilvimarinus sp. DA14]UTF58725.1 transporter substrate-binding domain-containing protein [Gilvimarinus sp. DA14]
MNKDKGIVVRQFGVLFGVMKAALVAVGLLWGAKSLAEPVTLKFISLEVAPWGWQDADSGEMKGAFIEMVKALRERVDADIEVSLTPFARVDRELELGSHDCTILVPRSEEFVTAGELVAYHDIGVVPAKNVELPDYSALEGKKVALIRGSSITPQFDTDESFIKVLDTDYLMSLRKLARARVDAIAGAIPTIRYLADNNNLGDKLGQPLKLADVPLRLQCSNKSPHLQLLPTLNRAIAEMKAQGVIDRIKSQYYF